MINVQTKRLYRWLHGRNSLSIILCGRVLISALLLRNITTKQELDDQCGISVRLLSGKISSERFENGK